MKIICRRLMLVFSFLLLWQSSGFLSFGQSPFLEPLPKLPPPLPLSIHPSFRLGNERLLSEFSAWIDGKRVGLVTNQTGVDRHLQSTTAKLFSYPHATLTALYAPEHGLDGKRPAGAWVESLQDPILQLPVYSLYGATRQPTAAMLQGVDVLVFDMQDIGARTYTYMSTLQYVMKSAALNQKKVIVLDRPNPLGGLIAEGYVLEERFQTFVGCDALPAAHGMTAGELALFFNRKIHCDLSVVPMSGWNRSMIWQDTGLPFVKTSPNIPDIRSAFCYLATGMGDGTGVGMGDTFTWVGKKGLSSRAYAAALNAQKLPGVRFEPWDKKPRGGVKLVITNYHTFNPARTGYHVLAVANQLQSITVPVSKGKNISMFDKVAGTDRLGKALLSKKTPQQIQAQYQPELQRFLEQRKSYLLYP